jgi:hypothetical protein
MRLIMGEPPHAPARQFWAGDLERRAKFAQRGRADHGHHRSVNLPADRCRRQAGINRFCGGVDRILIDLV